MIKTTVETVYISDDGEQIKIPFTPCDHLHGLPNDGVVNDDNEIRFAVLDEVCCSFEDIFGDENIVFLNNFTTGFDNFRDEMTAKGYDIYRVGKYEHGYVQYSLYSEFRTDWDYGLAGLIAVNKEIQDTLESATIYLDYYTDWANGNVYSVVAVSKDDPDDYDCIGGFIGSSDTVNAVLSGDY